MACTKPNLGYVLNVIREGKSVRAHPKLGIRERGWVELKSTDLEVPIKAGELVIVERGYNLPEGTPVKTHATSSDDSAAATASGETGEPGRISPHPATASPGGST